MDGVVFMVKLLFASILEKPEVSFSGRKIELLSSTVFL